MLDEPKATECKRNAVNAFGTATVFERRARRTRRLIRTITFLGVLGPALLGALAGAYGLEWKYLPHVMFVAALIGGGQFILSLWALVWQWDGDLTYALEATSINYRLASAYHSIIISDAGKQQVAQDLAALDAEARARSQMDNQAGISDKEKRRGMRAALRHFEMKCVGCEQIPRSLKNTKCEVCGKFGILNL